MAPVTVKKNQPTLRFPEYNDVWKSQKLEFLIEERNEYSEEELPLFSLTIENGVIPKSERYERGFLVKSEGNSYKVMKPNDFAYNPMNLRFGALSQYKGNQSVFVSKYYNIFYSTDKAVSSFLELYLTMYRMVQYYNKMATGTLEEKKRVHFSDFLKFNILLPSLPEQKKIADFLSAVDDKLQHLTKKKELLEKYRKGVMQKIFNQEIRFKDDNGNDYPEWEEKRLGKLLSFLPTYSFSRNSLNYEKGLIKNIHYGDIHKKFRTNFDAEKEQIPFINPEEDISNIKEDSYCKIGDIIFADASEDYLDVGKAIEIRNTNKELIVSGLHTFLARPKTNNMAIGFMGYLLKSNNIRFQIMKVATGISVLGISKQNLAKVTLFLPSSSEQQKIADFLTQIDNIIDLVKTQLEQTQQFKKGLLQQMFV